MSNEERRLSFPSSSDEDFDGEGSEEAHEEGFGEGFGEGCCDGHLFPNSNPSNSTPEVVGEGHVAEVVESYVVGREGVTEFELVHEGEGDHVVFGEVRGERGEGEGRGWGWR